MKFSEQWLREWVDPALNTQQLANQITMAGLEVDAVEPVAAEFSGIIVGEVLSIKPHPNADKLQICQVTNGNETLQIVCGARNVTVNEKYPLAIVGAKLPGFEIKPTEIRSVESFGMLCSEKELGLTEEADGLMTLSSDATVGADFRKYLSLNDDSICLDLTPNRSDCLSVRGLAREVGALNQCDVKAIDNIETVIENDEKISITIDAKSACPRYAGRVVKNINANVETPLWLREKLRRSGVRSIHPVVDVTNYVMLELGQPMHAFDLDALQGGIRVRMSQKNESLVLLDGQEINLTENTLVIADDQCPVAMAGIMGGAATGVTNQTVNIVLESAFFTPIAIAGKARAYGLHTDSSHRFERGVDYQLQREAIERATDLLISIVSGHAGPIIEEVATEYLPLSITINLRKLRVQRVLGITLSESEIEKMLTGLGFVIQDAGDDAWQIVVPSYRFDIRIEEDLIEEVARVHGYLNIPSSVPQTRAQQKLKPENELGLNQFRQLLIGRGYQEAITYSFVDTKDQQLFDPENKPLALVNPIASDLSVMRTSLWPGLIKSLQYNLNRQQSRVRLFETGLRFLQQENGILQQPVLAGVAYGQQHPENWSDSHDAVDFFSIKGDVSALLAVGKCDAQYTFKSGKHPALHPGRCAIIESGDKVIGIMGGMHPEIQRRLSLPEPAVLFELDLSEISTAKLPKFESLSHFPEIRRDLAIVVDQTVAAASIVDAIRSDGGEWLQNCIVFDQYQGKGIDPHRKSLALGLTWQHPSRTLNDAEIESQIQVIVLSLENKFNAELRQ